jgi:hypothetical protein
MTTMIMLLQDVTLMNTTQTGVYLPTRDLVRKKQATGEIAYSNPGRLQATAWLMA